MKLPIPHAILHHFLQLESRIHHLLLSDTSLHFPLRLYQSRIFIGYSRRQKLERRAPYVDTETPR